MGKIIVIGCSGHAKVVLDIIDRSSGFQVIGLVDSFKPVGEEFQRYKVLGSEYDIPELVRRHGVSGGFVAIGHNWIRSQMAERIQQVVPDFDFVNVIHPSANVARDVQIGSGVAIMAGASINPGTRVGDFCFVNTNASVDHDNVLDEFSCLQPNAATGGNVRVGSFSAISIGANVIHGINIGSHTVVGAGSTVLTDLPDGVVAYGTPCRVIRARKPEDSYY